MNFPSDFLVPGVAFTVGPFTQTNPKQLCCLFLPAGPVSQSSILLSVNASQSAAPGKYTVTLNGITFGSQISAFANQFNVSTSTDWLSNVTNPIGGVIQSPSLKIAESDRDPNSRRIVTISFKVSTSLPVGGLVTFHYPVGYFTPDIGDLVIDSNALIPGKTGVNTLVLTAVTQDIAKKDEPYEFTINNMPLGPASPGYTCGFAVSTSSDYVSVLTPTPALGSQVSNVLMDLLVSDRIPLAFGKSVTFTFQTNTALDSNQAVTISFPPNYFLSPNGIQSISQVLPQTAAVFSSVSFDGAKSLFRLTVGNVGAPKGMYKVIISNVTVGYRTLGNPNGIMVSTDTDSASFAPTFALGGQTQNVQLAIAPEDRAPGATNRSVTLTFTTQTILFNQSSDMGVPGTFDFLFPSASIFATGVTPGIIQKVPDMFVPLRIVEGGRLTVAVFAASAPAGQYSITLTGINFARDVVPASCLNDTLFSTVSDLPSTFFFGSLGGSVQNVALRIEPSNNIPRTTQTVTVSFTTQTPLSQNNKIVITLPAVYIFLGSGSLVISCFRNCPFQGTSASVSISGSSTLITITCSRDVPAGLFILSFQAQLGPPRPAASAPMVTINTVSVSTDRDLAGAGLLPAIGGQVSKVQLAVSDYNFKNASQGTMITVSFTTQTPLQLSSRKITVSFPDRFLRNMPMKISVELNGISSNSSSVTSGVGDVLYDPTRVVFTVSLPTLEVGDFIMFIGPMPNIVGLSRGRSNVVCLPNISFSVQTDNDLPGYSTIPAMSGQVSEVQFAVSSTVPYTTGQSATFSFRTATLLSGTDTITILWPKNYLVRGLLSLQTSFAPLNGSDAYILNGSLVQLNNTGLEIGLPRVLSDCCQKTCCPLVPMNLSPGFYTVTVSGLIIGPPTPASSTNSVMGVSTSVDEPGFIGYPALGGVVTGTNIRIPPFDQIVRSSNRKIVISFSTSTSLVCGDTITVTFPFSFLHTVGGLALPSNVTGLPVTFGSIVQIIDSNPQQQSRFVLKATAAIVAGSQSFTICGVTIKSVPNFPSDCSFGGCGIQVWTNRDYTSVFGPITITPNTYLSPSTRGPFQCASVTNVSMTIPWANRKARNSGQSVTFTFTTPSELPAGYNVDLAFNNSIFVHFPNDFFVKNSGECGVAGISVRGLPADYQFNDFFYNQMPYDTISTKPCQKDSLTAPCNTFNIFSPTNAALPAGAYTITVNGLTFGDQTAGVDGSEGIKGYLPQAGILRPIFVSTSLHLPTADSSRASSGPLSGYLVTSFTLPTCRVNSACQSVGVSFMSNAGPIFFNNTLEISFSPTAPISGSLIFKLQDAWISASVSGNTLRLTPVFGSYTPIENVTNTINIPGLTIVPTTASSDFHNTYASMRSIQPMPLSTPMRPSTPSYSAPFVPTSSGLSNTISLSIANPTASSTTSATVSFNTVFPVNVNDFIYVTFPTNFFVIPTYATCPVTSAPLPTVYFAPTTCSLDQSCRTTFQASNFSLFPYNPAMSFFSFKVLESPLPAGPKTIVISGLIMGPFAPSSRAFSVSTTNDMCSAGFIQTPAIQPIPPPVPSPSAVTDDSSASAASTSSIVGAVLGSLAGKLPHAHQAQ
jgi:hypothetical protein